jgi:glycosyltransferase involved in cell wall biosynthesis
VELHGPEGTLAGATGNPAVLHGLLAPVERLRIVYSCGVGDPDPIALPALMRSLRRSPDDRMEARLHDHFPLSPSYCLLGSDGRHRGPVPADCADPAHRVRRPDGRRADLGDWRAAWHGFLSDCAEVTAFSRSGAELFCEAYPDLAGRLRLRPHAPDRLPGPVAPPDGPGAIGVLGNLNRQKGAEIVAALALRLKASGDPRPVVVIGNVDPTCRLPRGVRLHGGYRREDIAALARRHRVSAWIAPSIWPETFSFTTREALATGLPVLAFALGGQGEAVAEAPNGRAVAFDPDADLAARLHAALPPLRRASAPGAAPVLAEAART